MKKLVTCLKQAGSVSCLFLFLGLLSLNVNAVEKEDSEISSIQIQSHILGEQRTVSVSLPEGYTGSASDYPVLYTLDAEHKPSFVRDCTTVADLTRDGKIPPVIIIGIWNAEGMRNRDMIPASVSHRPGSGGAKLFLRFIREELMPHIKKNYRTSDMSLIYGASNAGLFVVYAMLEDPELFEACVAASPMIGHCSDFMQISADNFVKRNPMDKRILYMIYGTEDSPRVTNFVPAFQKFLEKNAPGGFKSYQVILKGEGHVPSGSLEKGLRVIFADSPS